MIPGVQALNIYLHGDTVPRVPLALPNIGWLPDAESLLNGIAGDINSDTPSVSSGIIASVKRWALDPLLSTANILYGSIPYLELILLSIPFPVTATPLAPFVTSTRTIIVAGDVEFFRISYGSDGWTISSGPASGKPATADNICGSVYSILVGRP